MKIVRKTEMTVNIKTVEFKISPRLNEDDSCQSLCQDRKNSGFLLESRDLILSHPLINIIIGFHFGRIKEIQFRIIIRIRYD